MNAPEVISFPGLPPSRGRALANDIRWQVLTALGRKRLHAYVKSIWHLIEPGTAFKDNWHIGAICEHLEAVSLGQIRRLVINMPPRSLKSILVSVAWQTWDWIPHPALRWIFSSYAAPLSTRDSMKCRRIIESNFYTKWYNNGEDSWWLVDDNNQKTRFENSRTGVRLATSVGGVGTGEGGDRIVIDDPHNVVEGESDLVRESVLTWWDEAMSTRFNDPSTGAAVLVMQRVHDRDLSGHVLSKLDSPWDHLCLPMRYESTRQVFIGGKVSEVPTHDVRTRMGFEDPRLEDGQLLHPARFNEADTKALESELGSYGTAGQLQQRPTPRGGAIFKRGSFNFYRDHDKLTETLVSVDCAFKDLTSSDYVAIQVWGKVGPRKYLLHRVRERLGFSATVNACRTVMAKFPGYIACVIEDKANGPAVVETLQKELPRVIAVNPEGGKIARAYSCEVDVESGNIYLPDPSMAPWVEDWLAEITRFPTAAHDDEVDAFTQALTWFRTREGSMGFLVYARQQIQQMEEERARAVVHR